MFGVSRRHCKTGILDGDKHGSNQTQLLREERDLVKLLELSICDGDYCFFLAKHCSQPLISSTLSPVPSTPTSLLISPTGFVPLLRLNSFEQGLPFAACFCSPWERPADVQVLPPCKEAAGFVCVPA